ncbi:hypothetical protein EBU58_11135 [bacterium]|nr:hypothetical protein [bacterium]
MSSKKTEPDKDTPNPPEQPDFYLENGLLVFTAAHHLKRCYCCGSGCRHCPYEPRHKQGNTKVRL